MRAEAVLLSATDRYLHSPGATSGLCMHENCRQYHFCKLASWCAPRLMRPSCACVQVRFLFPVLPLFNVAGAAGLVRMYRNRQKGLLWQGLWLIALAALACSATAVVLMTAVSGCNYPGGRALAKMHAAEASLAAEALRSGTACLKQTCCVQSRGYAERGCMQQIKLCASSV